jgi:hypothetical protein
MPVLDDADSAMLRLPTRRIVSESTLTAPRAISVA